jgi:competence protein ComEA
VFDPDRRHLIAYLAAAAVLVVIAARFVGGGGSAAGPSISMAAPTPPAPQAPARARPRGQPLIWVDVAGAVAHPGLYSLPQGARIAAAIERAGGVRARANQAAVNLAAKLSDGQQVFVPARGSIVGGAAGPASAAGAPAGSAIAAGPRISLSTATQEQLEQLDGIGPALAQRIIQYRDQHGGFRSIDELQEVSGIGEKRLQALKPSIEP